MYDCSQNGVPGSSSAGGHRKSSQPFWTIVDSFEENEPFEEHPGEVDSGENVVPERL